jgi:hypothetical protein
MNQGNTPQPQTESEMLHLNLHAVPDGRYEPTSLLWKPEKEYKIVVQHTPKKVNVSDLTFRLTQR